MARDLESLEFELPDADCLLVVPPLAHLTWPALGAHVLQACGREAGFRVSILYMSALYAERVGPVPYAGLCNAPVHWLLGERLFARSAHDAPPLGFRTSDFFAPVERHNARVERVADGYVDHLSDSSGVPVEGGEHRYTRDDLLRWEDQATVLVQRLAAAIAARRYPIVGATTTFDQTSAGIALLQRVKADCPDTVTVMGGANCEGAMAEGIRSLSGAVDHVFSGESEGTFVAFLRAHRAGTPPEAPVIHGTPCRDLDVLPTPSFADWFEQLPLALGDTPTWVLYETSRGCWWGAKQHCTFCGLDDAGMAFREKSPDRVVRDLRAILEEAPTHRVCMTDNIMPHRYHGSLVPRLPADLPGIRVFYEEKANLTLAQVKGLFDAGCRSIQPGIEALDSDLLRLMRKGLLARQNVALLRYARAVGMLLKWNLLWGFPGDDAGSYRRTLDLLPLLRHLNPPQALAHLHLDRFSPYFEHPGDHGLTDLRPLEGYRDVFPPTADVRRLAYHFQAAYTSGSEADLPLMEHLYEEVRRWQQAWEGDPAPLLHLRRSGPGSYLLTDTRGLGRAPVFYLNDAQASAVLVGGPLEKVPAAEWAIRNRFAVDLDGWCVPLATAGTRLLSEFEARAGPGGDVLSVVR